MIRCIYDKNFSSLGGIAPKPRPITTEPCSMNLTDLADILTIGRRHKVMKNPKVSAQTDVPFPRYESRKYRNFEKFKIFEVRRF